MRMIYILIRFELQRSPTELSYIDAITNSTRLIDPRTAVEEYRFLSSQSGEISISNLGCFGLFTNNSALSFPQPYYESSNVHGRQRDNSGSFLRILFVVVGMATY